MTARDESRALMAGSAAVAIFCAAAATFSALHGQWVFAALDVLLAGANVTMFFANRARSRK